MWVSVYFRICFLPNFFVYDILKTSNIHWLFSVYIFTVIYLLPAGCSLAYNTFIAL